MYVVNNYCAPLLPAFVAMPATQSASQGRIFIARHCPHMRCDRPESGFCSAFFTSGVASLHLFCWANVPSQSSSRRCAALSFVKAAQVLHGCDDFGQGRLALGLRASAPPLAFTNPATCRASCCRRSLCCDIVPTLRLLSPMLLGQSLSDARRRRHLRALARSLPDEALAFLAHTALQTPVAFDGDMGSDTAAVHGCDLDIDDADEELLKVPSVHASESGREHSGVTASIGAEEQIERTGDGAAAHVFTSRQLEWAGDSASTAAANKLATFHE
jgi:hypothetical protein